MNLRGLLSAAGVIFICSFVMGLGQTNRPSEIKLTPELLNAISNSHIIAKAIKTTNDEPVGELVDVVVNWDGGAVQFVVMKAFDNIASGDHYIALPWPLLSYNDSTKSIQVRASLNQLRKAPRVQPGTWAGLTKDGNAKEIYAHFGQNEAAAGSSGPPVESARGGSDQWQRTIESDIRQPGLAVAGGRESNTTVYVFGALVVGILVGRYLLNRRAPRD